MADMDVSPSAMPQTDTLRAALEHMVALLEVARDEPARVTGTGAAAWSEAAALARGSVGRTSLEMRMVVTVDPGRTA